MKNLTTFIFLFFFSLCICADDKVDVRTGRDVTLAAEGIHFRSLKDCVLQPMPMPDRHTFTNGTNTIEGVQVMEMWFHEQVVAYLSAPGITIYVAVPDLPSPASEEISMFYPGYATPKAFEGWAEKHRKNPGSIDTLAWMSAFAGTQMVLSAETIKSASSASGFVQRYQPEVGDSPDKMYFLVGDRKYPGRFIAFRYEFENVEDQKKAERAVLSSVSSVQMISPKEDAKEDKQKLTRNSAKEIDYSGKYQRSKQIVINNIKNLPGWWYLETPNFILVSNMKKRSDIDKIQTEAEQIRAVYAYLIPPLVQIDDVSVIKVFESQEDYVAYVGENLKWTIGVWMASKKELVVSVAPWASGKDKMRQMVRTLYHELFHQYIFYATGSQHTHAWFNEGLAQYFEDIEIKNQNKFSFEPDKNLFDVGRKAAGSKYGDIRKLMDMEYEEFQKNYEMTYPAVWSMMYFMLNGAPVMKEKNNYSEIPMRYYKAVVQTKSSSQANKIAWEGVDLDKFNQDYREFWKGKSMFSRSIRNSMTPLIQTENGAPAAAGTRRGR